MWASSWAAHLGLTWSPRPKKHPADMGCLHCSNLGCPVWAAPIEPTISPCGLVHGCPLGPDVEPPAKKNIQSIWAAYIIPTWAAQMGNPDCAHNRPARTSSWAAHLGLT